MYQVNYSCSVPDEVKKIKSFNELVASENEPTDDDILSTIEKSFENAGVEIGTIVLSADLRVCDITLKDGTSLRVLIRWRPSLVIGDKIYRLSEFDI
jgi:hypothetical protein